MPVDPVGLAARTDGEKFAMTGTIVHQSCPDDRPTWLTMCLESVAGWASTRGYDYYCSGDEIFEPIPPDLLDRAGGPGPIAADLGRLLQARQLLARGYERTVWVDADVLVFAPVRFDPDVPEGHAWPAPAGFAFGREAWITADNNRPDGIAVQKNVHNAAIIFDAGNAFLDFYIGAAHSILSRHRRPPAPQIIGPKFLKCQHNVLELPLFDDVAMISPLVMAELSTRTPGSCCATLRRHHKVPPAAANLCASLVGRTLDGIALDERIVLGAASWLMDEGSV